MAGEPSRDAITGVLPLKIQGNRDDRDFGRAKLLFDSLARFAEPGLFRRILVLTPPDEVALVAERAGRWPSLNIEVVDENTVAPALAPVRDITGWTRQMILKLAVSRRIDTAFYLTFDADVICTHRLDRATLLPGGRALLQLWPKDQGPNRINWWLASARILGVERRLDQPGMTPTPALLATEVCHGLLDRLDRIARPRAWTELLVEPLRARLWHHLVPGYKRRYRWSEYALYYLHCRDAGLFERVHAVCGSADAPRFLLSEGCIWNRRDFAEFDPAFLFSERDPALFAIVQSNKELDPELVRAQVAPYLR